MTKNDAVNKVVVDPGLYSKEYFLSDNEGWKEYLDGLDSNIHTKFKRILNLGEPKKDESVLDIGCGRGELLYYCAKRGAMALGLDYSKDAIAIARSTIDMLPSDVRGLARAEVGDAATFDFDEEFDLIFMVETLEHMYDWQLESTFNKIEKILKPGGRLVMITPNYYYEKYLSVLKRVVGIPFNLLKLPFRLFKDKYRKIGFSGLLRKAVRVRVDRGELNRKMHVNVTTPATVRKLLTAFDAKVWCEDHSGNILSVISKRWWGRDIVVIAKKCAKSS